MESLYVVDVQSILKADISDAKMAFTVSIGSSTCADKFVPSARDSLISLVSDRDPVRNFVVQTATAFLGFQVYTSVPLAYPRVAI